jgi:hypothetical protein
LWLPVMASRHFIAARRLAMDTPSCYYPPSRTHEIIEEYHTV